MGRELRYQSKEWETFELTSRCVQGRLLLTPGQECNRRLLGVLARSLEKYGEHIHLYFVGGTSNHLHMVLASENPWWRGLFKSHFKTNVAKELGDLFSYDEGIWSRRSKDIPILDDDALLGRLAYLAAHGVKENLVDSPFSWPGVQWCRAVTSDYALVGNWYDRSRLFRKWQAYKGKKERAAAKGRAFDEKKPTLYDKDVLHRLPVKLTPIPQWADLPVEEQRERWKRLIEHGVATHSTESRFPPLGAERLRKQDPHQRPRRKKKTPAPRAHYTVEALYEVWLKAYREFVRCYREAMTRFTAGDPTANFPAFSLLPAGIPAPNPPPT